MTNEHITRVSREEAAEMTGQTEWDRLRAASDEEVEREIAEDPEASTDDFDFAHAKVVRPRHGSPTPDGLANAIAEDPDGTLVRDETS